MRDPKILIVSYLFPPAGGITVQRALSLAKYLPRCGYEVHVLTASNAAAPVRDPGLLRMVPAEVTIHRAFIPEVPFALRHAVWQRLAGLGGHARAAKAADAGGAKRGGSALQGIARRILCPDPEILWYPFLLHKARRIIERHGIDILMVTAPPYSAFLAGNRLKRRFPHLKYVSDWRDEWLRYFLTDFDYQSGDYTRRRAEQIERETIETSDLVVAVAESSLDAIRERYPAQPASKFAYVPNGYDPDVLSQFRPRPSTNPKMVVTHMGTVYKTSSPSFFLNALDEMPDDFRANVEVRFVGRVAQAEQSVFQGRRSDIRLLGFMPQGEALRHLEETDYLLLTMTNDISLPGKIYEYLATGKPILALSPGHGEVKRLLTRTGGGWCVDPNDGPAIQEMLRQAWARKQAGSDRGFPKVDWQEVRRHSRPALVAEYANLMADLVGSTPARMSDGVRPSLAEAGS